MKLKRLPLVRGSLTYSLQPTGGKGVPVLIDIMSIMVTNGRKGSDVQPGRRHRCKMKK